MEIAVLSDIHSNYIALDTCMDYIRKRKIDRLIFLGDYLADMPHPQKTMERIYQIKEEYNCIFIRGNKEDYWKDHQNGKSPYWCKGSTGGLLYTYEQLTEKDFEFYDSLPSVMKLEIPGLPVLTLCHGSPFRTNENIRPGKARTFEIMEAVDTDIILCGHTHVQGKIEYTDCVEDGVGSRVRVGCDYGEFKSEHAGKKVLNCGAVGVPYGSEGKTQLMILHGEEGVVGSDYVEHDNSSRLCGEQCGTWREEFISLDYDRDSVIEEMMNSKIYEYSPIWCQITAHLLRKGKPAHGHVLVEAMKLCEEETGSAVWYDVPEKYWHMAMERMFL